jgi:hypothetical protein
MGKGNWVHIRRLVIEELPSRRLAVYKSYNSIPYFFHQIFKPLQISPLTNTSTYPYPSPNVQLLATSPTYSQIPTPTEYGAGITPEPCLQ